MPEATRPALSPAGTASVRERMSHPSTPPVVHGLVQPQTPYSAPMPAKPRLVVEFLGLPGAGKTTLCNHLADALRARRIPVEIRPGHTMGSHRAWRLAKLGQVVGEIARHPGRAYRFARAVTASGQRSPIDALKVLHNWLFVCSLLRKPVVGVCLIDQGVAQAMWSVALSARDGTTVRTFRSIAADIRPPDLLVVVSAQPATVRSRLAARVARTSRLEAAPDGPAMRRAAMLIDELATMIAGSADGRTFPYVLRIDNDRQGHADRAAALLVDRILQELADKHHAVAGGTGRHA